MSSILNEIVDKATLSLAQQLTMNSIQHQRIAKILFVATRIMSISEDNIQKIILPNHSLEELYKIWRNF